MTLESDSALRELRSAVRAFVEASYLSGAFEQHCDSWMRGHDPAFSRSLAARGWLGLTWPAEFGGGERSNLARLAVTEELLRYGAPVAAHWMADRQIGPAILRYGTPELKARFLPGIVSGEITFCVAMSETEAGSDLAAVRTRAEAVEGGWRVNGAKVWTSNAHRSTHAYLLARTDASGKKHEGLTEFVLDLASPGISIRPILDLAGEHHFNEVVFDDVFVPADQVLGTVGGGWTQVTEQLSFERGGVERVLSTYPLLVAFKNLAYDAASKRALGELTGRLKALRGLARDVAGEMDAGRAPIREAAVLKLLGTAFEKDVVSVARHATGARPDPGGGRLPRLLAESVLAAPGFTLRGGTTEVLGTIVARGLDTARPRSFIRDIAHDVLRDEEPRTDSELWVMRLADLGWHDAEDADLLALLETLGELGICVPLAETALANALVPPNRRMEMATVVPVPGAGLRVTREDDCLVLDGSIRGVPWAAVSPLVVLVLGDELVLLDGGVMGWRVEPGWDLAGEPYDTIHFNESLIEPHERVPNPWPTGAVLERAALLRSARTVGAMRAALRLSVQHTRDRTQFGRPLRDFQAVSQTLARAAAHLALAESALARATDGYGIAALRIVLAEAADEIAAAAHQVHGAIGVTREHRLHHHTRLLWASRDDGAPAHHWADLLADAARDSDLLWDLTGD
ncbi:alkylation response protein AidB-like acyl-CoA dehydrogenase [Actinocorallia herbida]|uniref:Alkylation response protein AidB-like acyl-CoA dehydrogenase n=1 Tax=Actinocorallia herbida TaxID=58109 RepID=A0A3N1CTD3_9ACTN|nr:acyl-CoA dehydrogenase family protein [Actinocorallia herbida]ROO84573.1 alkylation response protein AidB-like acyl-CoA dehydrogenase [Actinocorallia herbida]